MMKLRPLVVMMFVFNTASAVTSDSTTPIVGHEPLASDVKITSVDSSSLIPYEFSPKLDYTFSDPDGDVEDLDEKKGTSFSWQFQAEGSSTWSDLGHLQILPMMIPLKNQGGVYKACVTPKTNNVYTMPFVNSSPACVEKRVKKPNFTSDHLYSTNTKNSGSGSFPLYDVDGKADQPCPRTGSNGNRIYCERWFTLENSDTQVGNLTLTLYRTNGGITAYYEVRIDESGDWYSAKIAPNSGVAAGQTFLLPQKVTSANQKVFFRTTNELTNNNYGWTAVNIAATIY